MPELDAKARLQMLRARLVQNADETTKPPHLPGGACCRERRSPYIAIGGRGSVSGEGVRAARFG
jgi:hypothetical protein